MLGVALLANEAAWYAWDIRQYGFSLKFSLPMELCDFSLIAAVFALITRRQLLYEWAYFYGIGGATQALLTPELEHGFPSYPCLKFFASHGGILAAVAVLTLGLGMRPVLRSIPRMMIAGTLYMIFTGAVDWMTGANYGFLRSKPVNPSLLDHLGPWPWYWASLWLLGAALILILYAPFWIHDALGRRRPQPAKRVRD